MPRFEFLSETFLNAMEDIGRYGYQKHKENSFKSMLAGGNTTRKIDRHQTEEIMRHARNHTLEYEAGIPHDHFDDLLHQLAAVAFNAMVEAQFAGLVKDES